MAKGVALGRDQIAAAYSLPIRGVIRTVPASQLPPNALRDADNVIIVGGVLQPRPGLLQFSATLFGARPTGAIQYEGSGGNDPIPVVATVARIWKFESGAWTDITGTVLTATADQPARMTTIQINNDIFLIHVNGKDAPQQWKKPDATAVAVAGTPPIFTDIATASDHLIGIVPPYTIRWSTVLNIGSWPALNVRHLSSTNDPLVAIGQLSPLAFAVYKRKSLWLGLAQGGSDAAAFNIFMRRKVDGPAGPNARVNANGTDYYMTPTGRIGKFDGVTHQWVADGVWPIIRGEIDTTSANRIFGFYLSDKDTIVFMYPKSGDAGELKRGVAIVLPQPDAELPFHAAFLQSTAEPLSAGTAIQLTDLKDNALLFGSTAADQRSFTFEGTQDDLVDFTGSWQTGITPLSALDPARVESIEPFLERGVGFGTLTMKPVTSNVLDTPGGTVGAATSIDLTKVPVKSVEQLDARARFLGVRFEFTSNATVRYKGAVAYRQKAV